MNRILSSDSSVDCYLIYEPDRTESKLQIWCNATIRLIMQKSKVRLTEDYQWRSTWGWGSRPRVRCPAERRFEQWAQLQEKERKMSVFHHITLLFVWAAVCLREKQTLKHLLAFLELKTKSLWTEAVFCVRWHLERKAVVKYAYITLSR